LLTPFDFWISSRSTQATIKRSVRSDWGGFKQFTDRLGNKIEVVGDDIFVTNTRYIRRGIEEGAANSALIKLNQVGTVSETIEAVRMMNNESKDS